MGRRWVEREKMGLIKENVWSGNPTKDGKKNCDMAMMWLNWSVATINAILELYDIYIYIYTQ